MTPPDVFDASRPRVYSIDSGRPFLVDLARGIASRNPLDLTECLIYVPTRRAERALADEFARAGDARAALLPRIRALGDIDDIEWTVARGGAEIDPAATLLERRLTLAEFVAAEAPIFSGLKGWGSAMAAAAELGKLFESLYTEEIDFARIERLAPFDHAEHWTRALDFLKRAHVRWRMHLAERGLLDPAERRSALIDAEAQRLAAAPPDTPVIVAGTTGSAPAVARLMRVVASLPKGAVVLPGLDFTLWRDGKAWSAIGDPDGEAHSQAGLKKALDALSIAPASVRAWPGSGGRSPRSELITLALRPAAATDDWLALSEKARTDDPNLSAACAGLHLVEAEDEDGEASAVALLFREAIETPGRTAMLVTPDRALARRVAAKMRRWNVNVDDSAGMPLADAPVATFLRILAEWLAAPARPLKLLALIRNPVAGFGLAARDRRAAADALDKALRGAAPTSLQRLGERLADDEKSVRRTAPIFAALERGREAWPASPAAFSSYLDALLRAAEMLAATDAQSGDRLLWRGEDGVAAAELLAQLREVAPRLGEISAVEFAQGLSETFRDVAVRRRSGHPRLAILGPLEARLQSADLVILGGLNEGGWPGDPAADPFLSRAMRVEIGLPSPEWKIGIAAHDFAQLAAAPAVALTRARRSAGSPTKPSRWIVRLKNILGVDSDGEKRLPASVDASARLKSWARALDRPDTIARVGEPRPKPPVHARPKRLSVSRFEDLMRDPYSVYARFILNLRALDPVDEPLYPRRLGLFLHNVFERFMSSAADPAAADARVRLADLLRDCASEHDIVPVDLVLWRTRLDAALDWFVDFDGAQRMLGRPAVIETRGEASFADLGGFTLTATPDRIDLLANGAAAILDYKSGAPPTIEQMQAKFSPQLALTALIVEEGGFAPIGLRRVECFGYVKSLNRNPDARKNFAGADGAKARALIDETRRSFAALVALFDNPDTPYLSQPRPKFANQYGRYDHLARRREWALEEDEDEA